MKVNSKPVLVPLLAALVLSLFAQDRQSNGVSVVRAKLQECVAALPDGNRGTPEYMMEFGMAGAVRSLTQELGTEVSNCVDAVYRDFPSVATNAIERRILLASAWRLGDDYYLDSLSRNVDLAIAGAITADDLQWFMKGHRTRRLTYILAAQYDRPGVSNIVHRLLAYTGETNKYEKVFSGEAKLEYIEFERFMAEGPEAPRQD